MGNLDDDNKTYIKLYRKVMDNAIFLELPYDRWHAFEFLLLKARRFPTVTILKGKPIKLEVGQLICGEEKLAVKWGWSRGKVKRYLDMLENLGMIKKNGTPYGTLITIENYTKYQGECSYSDTPLGTSDGTSLDTSDGTSDGTHKKNVKKDKNVKNVKKDIYIGVPDELKTAFMEFAEMREAKKKPIMTENTITRILNRLEKFAASTDEKIAILNQSTDHCWIDVYDLKDKPKKGTGNPYLDMLGDECE